MLDYREIKINAEKHIQISNTLYVQLIKDHVLYKEKLKEPIEGLFKRYPIISEKIKDAYSFELFFSCMIMQKVFRKNGLIHKLIKHENFRSRSSDEKEILRHYLNQPCVFRHCIIKNIPKPDFFEMIDSFTGEEFLVYSPSMTKTYQMNKNPKSWLLLVFDNGLCKHTFGPVLGLKYFGADDFYFLASELNKNIESDEDVWNEINLNPFPFLNFSVLASIHREKESDEEIANYFSIYTDIDLDIERLSEKFQFYRKENQFKFILKGQEKETFNCIGYYDESEHTLYLSALLKRAYVDFIEELRKFNTEISPDYHMKLNILLTSNISKLLGYEVGLHPMDLTFNPRVKEEDNVFIKFNHFMHEAVELRNRGIEPNIMQLSIKHDLDYTFALENWEAFLKNEQKRNEDKSE